MPTPGGELRLFEKPSVLQAYWSLSANSLYSIYFSCPTVIKVTPVSLLHLTSLPFSIYSLISAPTLSVAGMHNGCCLGARI